MFSFSPPPPLCLSVSVDLHRKSINPQMHQANREADFLKEKACKLNNFHRQKIFLITFQIRVKFLKITKKISHTTRRREAVDACRLLLLSSSLFFVTLK
jgi:hypothetical protein